METKRHVRRAQRASISRKIGLLSALTLIATALLSSAALIGFIQINAAISSVVGLADVSFAQRESLLTLVNEEADVRGYIASGDPAFLASYDEERKQFDT